MTIKFGILLLESFKFSICFLFLYIITLYKKLNLLFLKIQQFDSLNKTNIDLNDEFFQLREVKEQIYINNFSYIGILSSCVAHVGNALLILNNLINICERIKCRYIVVPGGLDDIIKNPVFYKDYNITIFPNSYKNKLKIDIKINAYNSFYFRYKNHSNKMRLSILREEILNNIPKYVANPNDLYINIRSGDIFVNVINKNYAQPPLCFYQKIINENNFNKIFIISNGHENPVVDELLKLYPKIKYSHDSVLSDISLIVNAYNLVMPVSTFTSTLIRFNNNLKNIYIYKIFSYNLKNINCTIHKMEASIKYKRLLQKKWKNTKEQLYMMLNEKCSNSKFIIFNVKN